jgi:hypothetical protein
MFIFDVQHISMGFGVDMGTYLCGLVARVPGYKSRDPGSILGATRVSET